MAEAPTLTGAQQASARTQSIKDTTTLLLPDGDMRLTKPRRDHRFGCLHIAEEIRAVELDAGETASVGGHSLAPWLEAQGLVDRRAEDDGDGNKGQGEASELICCPRAVIQSVLEQMVIVVPCKDEDINVIREVVSAIPPSCLVILASNCERLVHDGHDPYVQQVEMLETLVEGSTRQVLAIHQKDLGAAIAFEEAGMPELIDPLEGRIRSGKGEGMLLGIAIAAAFFPERRYVGFIDADNFFPVSVNEYCRIFAVGLALALPPELEHAMVRLRWSSKPKVSEGQVRFVPEGRCSRVVNSWLNALFNSVADSLNASGTNGVPDKEETTENGFVSTGNAGEHAMTMDLALKLRMAAGYAIEPFHFIDLLERSGLPLALGAPPEKQRTMANGSRRTSQPLQKPVHVIQIRTLCPHFHRPGNDGHIRRMWAAGLGAVYHHLPSYQADPGAEVGDLNGLREDIHAYAAKYGGLSPETGELPQPTVYPALEDIDMRKFRKVLLDIKALAGSSLQCFGLGRKGHPFNN